MNAEKERRWKLHYIIEAIICLGWGICETMKLHGGMKVNKLSFMLGRGVGQLVAMVEMAMVAVVELNRNLDHSHNHSHNRGHNLGLKEGDVL